MAASMGSSSRSIVLSLYRQMLKESKKFTGYNYREYALRRTKDAFRNNKNISDGAEITALIQKAQENLAVIKRQVVISQLYKEPALVIEGIKTDKR